MELDIDKFKNIVKSVPDKIQNVVKPMPGGGTAVKSLKSELDEKRNEKIKTFGFIGMEVYDLAMAGRVDIPQIKGYIDKMVEIDTAIKELEAKIISAEQSIGNGNICSCGYRLRAEDKFCQNCGAIVVSNNILCNCGALLRSDAKFCQSCGARVEDLSVNNEPFATVIMKECLCGATVSADQFMCMECGRRLD